MQKEIITIWCNVIASFTPHPCRRIDMRSIQQVIKSTSTITNDKNAYTAKHESDPTTDIACTGPELVHFLSCLSLQPPNHSPRFGRKAREHRTRSCYSKPTACWRTKGFTNELLVIDERNKCPLSQKLVSGTSLYKNTFSFLFCRREINMEILK